MNLRLRDVRVLLMAVALAALMAGCGAEATPEAQSSGAGAPAPATVVSTAVEPTAQPALALLPTVTPNVVAPAPVETTPAQAAVPADWTQHAYLEGDYYILGNPDAPVRLIDYSDFL
jgi:protein-disulfide isomerase